MWPNYYNFDTLGFHIYHQFRYITYNTYKGRSVQLPYNRVYYRSLKSAAVRCCYSENLGLSLRFVARSCLPLHPSFPTNNMYPARKVFASAIFEACLSFFRDQFSVHCIVLVSLYALVCLSYWDVYYSTIALTSLYLCPLYSLNGWSVTTVEGLGKVVLKVSCSIMHWYSHDMCSKLYMLSSEILVLSINCRQERIRGRNVQPIELSEPKVRRVCCKNLPYKEGFCRPHKTAIVVLA